MNRNKEEEKEGTDGVNRRSFIAKTLAAGAGLAAWAGLPESAAAQKSKPSSSSSGKLDAVPGRRRLGKLEVSAIGMGVQNMHRRYETTVPYRPEMISILRAAYDRGITFFDCAEAYGPFENERILGEAIEPFRNKVRITSKFGWNIDQQTGRHVHGVVFGCARVKAPLSAGSPISIFIRYENTMTRLAVRTELVGSHTCPTPRQ